MLSLFYCSKKHHFFKNDTVAQKKDEFERSEIRIKMKKK
jgi:hypothetical protein